MKIVFFVLLLLVPACLIFALVVAVKARHLDGWTREDKYKQIVLPSAVLAVGCCFFLFVSGSFYGLWMTVQMPAVSLTQVTEDSTEVRLTEENIAFDGNKAVLVNQNHGAYLGGFPEAIGSVNGFFGDRFFKYSDQDNYLPDQYQATSRSDVGYFVFIRHAAEKSRFQYENEAYAYSHRIDVTITDSSTILAKDTFWGGIPSDTSGQDTLGPAPNDKAREWIAEQLTEIIPGQ